MKAFKDRLILILLVIAAAVLGACGGGGSDVASEPETATLQAPAAPASQAVGSAPGWGHSFNPAPAPVAPPPVDCGGGITCPH